VKHWKLWAALAGIAVLAIVGALVLKSRSKTSTTTTYTRLVTVQRGSLVASLTPTGEVEAKQQVYLNFDVNKIPVLEVKVKAGQEVKKGDVLVRIDPASLQRTLDQAKADLLSAEDALTEALEGVTAVELTKAELNLAQAQAAWTQAQEAAGTQGLRQAQFNLDSARLNLSISGHSTDVGRTVRDLQYNAAWHARKLDDLRSKLAQGKATQADVDAEQKTLTQLQTQLAAAQAAANVALASAQGKVTTAEDALAKLESGSDTLELTQAEYNLEQAQENLAKLTAGTNTKAVQLAQARYDAAKAVAEEAQATLDSATMVAPFNGTVISVGVEAGDTVSSGNVAVTLADLSTLRITAIIDESDISQVQVGQTAQITFDALTGKKFTGKVLEIPLQGTLSQNVLTYKVPVSLEGAAGAGLRPGMTANLKITVGQRQNTLLVPMLAVQEADSGSVVLLKDPTTGKSTQTPVELGLSDGTNSEVLRGLNEGDQVLVEYSTSTSTSTQFRNQGGSIQLIPGGLLR